MVHATAQQKSLTSAAYAQRTGAALLTDDAALLTSGGQKGKGKKSGRQGGKVSKANIKIREEDVSKAKATVEDISKEATMEEEESGKT
jgi:hypothetical protein